MDNTEKTLLIISLVIATIAAFMPLWQFLVKKLFIKKKIILHTDDKIDINFAMNLNKISSVLFISSVNKELVVKSISVKLKRLNDNKEIILECDTVKPPSYIEYVNQVFLPRPFKVANNGAECIMAYFSENNDLYKQKLKDLETQRAAFVSSLETSNKYNQVFDFDTKFATFIKDMEKSSDLQKAYYELVGKLQKELYWECGDYIVEYKLHLEKEEFSKQYKFIIDKEIVEKINSNINVFNFSKSFAIKTKEIGETLCKS